MGMSVIYVLLRRLFGLLSWRDTLEEEDVDDEVDMDDEVVADPKRRRRSKKERGARVLGIGDDGRKIYTADPDARAGHRSATNGREAGEYVGYEVHLAVLARDAGYQMASSASTSGPTSRP